MAQDLHPLTEKILKKRGIISDSQIAEFLNPSYSTSLYDPFLIHGMDRAVKRIIKAIKNDEIIAIYSDYDCDGIPGGVLLREFFDAISYKNVVVYIPHRHNEGYGLHTHAIDILKEKKVSLIITVDSGITNRDEVTYAENLGINVIVTDHHLPVHDNGKQLVPKAFVVLNSKQDVCTYPDDMLCGCALAWKVACAVLFYLKKEASLLKERDIPKPKAYDMVLQKVKELPEGYEKWLLDLVAISTISDMVPLVHENRALAHFGLRVLQKTRRPGLLHIYRNQNLNKDFLGEEDIAFTLAPRINAASRMGDPILAHNMLYEKDAISAQILVDSLEMLNNERKSGVKNVLESISFDHSVYARDVIVVGDESWGPGILGLIAQAIIEETGKPVFVWGQGDDKETLKGSCRSRGDVHVVDLMQKVGHEILLHYGGHEQAGGFSLHKEKKDMLLEAFNTAIVGFERKEIAEEALVPDEELSLTDVNDVTYNALHVLAPFGISNPKPLFIFRSVVPLSVRWFGKAGEHLEVLYGVETKKVKAIQFFAKKELEEKISQKHTLLAHIEKSYWGGRGELRLKILDIQ